MVRINRTWQDCAKTCGISLNLAADPPVFLWDLASFNRYQTGHTDLRQYYVELGEELGVTATEGETLHASILKEAYPGTLDLVEELHALGIPTGILSNTNEAHWERMMDPSLFPNIALLGVKVASFAVKLEKPDEAIYRRFEEISGLAPADLVFFDDTEPNVTAAREYGWEAHLVDPHGDTAAQMRSKLLESGLLDTEPR